MLALTHVHKQIGFKFQQRYKIKLRLKELVLQTNLKVSFSNKPVLRLPLIQQTTTP